MLINFMQIDNFATRPVTLGNNMVECVTTYKLLGVTISIDLKWNKHIDYNKIYTRIWHTSLARYS